MRTLTLIACFVACTSSLHAQNDRIRTMQAALAPARSTLPAPIAPPSNCWTYWRSQKEAERFKSEGRKLGPTTSRKSKLS